MDNSTSILNDIKKLLGINEEDTNFDTDVIIHINTIFMSLRQMGIGPENGFSIADSSSIWTNFSEDSVLLNSVKTYIYLRVKLVFDPPLSTSTIECYNKLVSEIEWRMHSRVTYANN